MKLTAHQLSAVRAAIEGGSMRTIMGEMVRVCMTHVTHEQVSGWIAWREQTDDPLARELITTEPMHLSRAVSQANSFVQSNQLAGYGYIDEVEAARSAHWMEEASRLGMSAA